MPVCMIAQHYLLQALIKQMEDICIIQWMQQLVKQQTRCGYILVLETMKELDPLTKEQKI